LAIRALALGLPANNARSSSSGVPTTCSGARVRGQLDDQVVNQIDVAALGRTDVDSGHLARQ